MLSQFIDYDGDDIFKPNQISDAPSKEAILNRASDENSDANRIKQEAIKANSILYRNKIIEELSRGENMRPIDLYTSRYDWPAVHTPQDLTRELNKKWYTDDRLPMSEEDLYRAQQAYNDEYTARNGYLSNMIDGGMRSIRGFASELAGPMNSSGGYGDIMGSAYRKKEGIY